MAAGVATLAVMAQTVWAAAQSYTCDDLVSNLCEGIQVTTGSIQVNGIMRRLPRLLIV